jgi:hypothetical protein
VQSNSNIFKYKSIEKKVEQIIEAAGEAGVNVLCLQEAWCKYSYKNLFFLFSNLDMPFAFCTREKYP